MEHLSRRTCLAWIGLAPALLHASEGRPNSWPAQPLRLIITGGPGSAPDFVGRVLAARMSDNLGAQVVVDPLPAGGGIVGVQALLGRPADGHTLVLGSTSMLAVTPELRKSPPYDVDRDLEPVGLVGSTSNVIVVSSSLPAQTLEELIAYARQHPGKLNYASTGTGSPAHIGGESLRQLARVDITHVPYKGAAQAMTDLAAGQVHLMVTSPSTAGSYVRNGRARLLASTGRLPDPSLPSVPLASRVLPGYQITQWFGLLVRKGTPEPIVQRLSAVLAEAMRDPKVVQALKAQSIEVTHLPQGPFREFIAKERSYYAQIIRSAGIQQE